MTPAHLATLNWNEKFETFNIQHSTPNIQGEPEFNTLGK